MSAGKLITHMGRDIAWMLGAWMMVKSPLAALAELLRYAMQLDYPPAGRDEALRRIVANLAPTTVTLELDIDRVSVHAFLPDSLFFPFGLL